MRKASESSRIHSYHTFIVVGDYSQALTKLTRAKFRSRFSFYNGWSTLGCIRASNQLESL